MHFIEHIIEPTELFLAWQSLDENNRTRYIVAKLAGIGEEINLTYLRDTKDFQEAQNLGFEGYPAFHNINEIHHNVLDAFMRRLPPRKRGDFPQYLEGLRLKPDVEISNFALLGYSGARLPSDGFSIIHPFNNVKGPCELLLEAAAYRHTLEEHNFEVQIGNQAIFCKEFYEPRKEEAIYIQVNERRIGWVTRGLRDTFNNWINTNRITEAWVEKKNGQPGKPMLFLYVKVSSLK